MSKKLKFKLSESGLDELLNKLNTLEVELDKAVRESIKEVADETKIKIIDKMSESRPPHGYNAIDTGDLANSTTIATQGNLTLITQEGENAFNVEFGDGLYFGDYPDISKIPSGVPEHTTSYAFTPKENSSRWQNSGFAHGQYAVGQMYHGGQYIRETLPKRVQKKGRDALSKI